MFRTRATITMLVVLLVSVGMMAPPALSLNAQESESGFPDSISVEQLVSGDAGDMTSGSPAMRLDRITLPPGSALEAHSVTQSEAIHVQSGEITLVDSIGLSSTLGEGNGAHLRAGASYEARNDGSADALFLRLSLVPVTASLAATPDASPLATPVTDDAVARVTTLMDAPLTDIPATPVNLVLTRATWAPGADSGSYTQTGPLGVLVEAGTLTITSPSGLDGHLDEDQAVLLPADQPLRARNDGTSEAIALMFGLVPASGALVQEVPPTPTPSPTPLPTAVPSPTPLPSPTAVPSPTPLPTEVPTPEPTPTPIPSLYRITAEEGFESWGGSGDWKTVDGMLINDGTNETEGAYIAAPYEPTTSNYAIEAEIQYVRGGGSNSFGIVLRATDAGAYWMGVLDHYWGNTGIAAGVEGGSSIASTDFQPEGEWHTYRAEVRGNELRLLVDGTVMAETTDNMYLVPGRIGLWSLRSQVSVRSFTVYSLDEGGSSNPQPEAAASTSDSPPIVGMDADTGARDPAGAALYQADASGGLDALSGPSWSQQDGMLVSDGRGEDSLANTLILPLDASTLADVAVEVDAMLGPQAEQAAFGIRARVSDEGWYTGGISTFDGEPMAYIRASGPDVGDEEGWLGDVPFSPGDGWHTYRLEVNGSAVRFLIDGQVVLEASDALFNAGSRVELFNYGAEATVSGIRVMGL